MVRKSLNGRGNAPEIVFIHGVGPKPHRTTLRNLWDMALLGHRPEPASRMAYWADLRLTSKGEPAPNTAEEDLSPEEKRLLEAFRRDPPTRRDRSGRVLPGALQWIGQPLMRLVTRWAARDAFNYFSDFNGIRERMRSRLVEELEAATDQVILISHSLGTVIAYDVLTAWKGSPKQIALFVTMGSPLGIREIQENLVGGTDRLRVPPGVRLWLNVADPFDFVALDKSLWGDFRPGDSGERVRNAIVYNPTSPHSSIDYLQSEPVRSAVDDMLKVSSLKRGSRIRRDILHSILQDAAANEFAESAADESNALPAKRYSVLIEPRDLAYGAAARRGIPEARKNPRLMSLDQNKRHIEKEIRSLEPWHGEGQDPANVDRLRHWIAATLTLDQISELEARGKLTVYCLWANTRKKALVAAPGSAIHVPAARVAYGADGDGVSWAVLDTGIKSDHPHFNPKDGGVIAETWDCTQTGKSPQLLKRARDPLGHGTHVAGIIAGAGSAGAKKGEPVRTGIAPRTRLHIFKVLDDRGEGDDASIIKALDKIAEMNAESTGLGIHGINLSLGGPYDASAYGVGHSPLCQELRRAWREGVVVCVAAGNEGVATVSASGQDLTLYPQITIGDPANLEECIAVGSVHSERPHTYGVSYFSSRGPTADGRVKPDVVAPGENIESCDGSSNGYRKESGTSMACPHVSGLIAAFLSVRREFIGRPDDVKRILLANCTDLGRDRYHQGAGLPNLIKMLANT